VVTHPKVVALVPAWQAADFIAETLASLAAQTWPNLEILIAVDQSSDDTAERCRAFAAAHANVRVHEHTVRHGWVGNVNWLLHEARGDYLFFAFHDDVLAPTYVEALAEALRARPDAILAFSDLENVHLDGRVDRSIYTTLEGLSSPVDRGRKLLWRIGDWWTPNRGLFRSEAARRIGGLKRHRAGEFSADWPWLFHMSLLGHVVRVPQLLCFKRYKVRSLSQSWRYAPREYLAALASCARELAGAPLTPREKWALRLSVWSVRRHLLRHVVQELADRATRRMRRLRRRADEGTAAAG
jgi:glycosyltransferase involved in cell wall biosynthesis